MRGRGSRAGVLLAFLLVAASATAHAQPGQGTTRILIAYGHDPNAPGVVAFAEPLKEVVRQQLPGRVEIYDEYLDLDRFNDPDRPAQLARYFAEKYQGFTPDAIVAEGSQALRFAADHLTTLFPGVPIVYGLVFEPIVDFSTLPPNITGRRQPLPFEQTFAMARALQPEARRVVLLAGASATDSAVVATGVREIAPLLNGMELEVLRDWSFDTLIDTLRAMPRGTILIFSSFRRDQRGQEFNSGDLIASLTKVASVPAYGIARNWLGDGIVGGGVMDFAEDGRRTGELLGRVLRRAPGEPLPPQEVAAASLVVDWRQLERWGLPADRLPPGTEIFFRTPSTWERYRSAILGVLALLVLESLLIGLLLVERKRRFRAQRAVEEQMAYEQLITGLGADTVRLSPGELSRALEDVLRRVSRFARADAGVLTLNPDDAGGAATRLSWSAADDRVRSGAAGADPGAALPGAERLEIPLGAENVNYGVLELCRADGEAWPGAMVARLETAGGLVARALARASAARALEETRGQVEHMARVATVSGLAAAVSHELRQPLTAIRINAEAGARLLARDPPDLDEVRIIFQDIVRDDVRASEVIEQFRALLTKRDPVSTVIDLNGVCRSTARLVDHEVRVRRARLAIALDPELPLVRGDPVLLQQVIINLTLNALDAVAASSPDREVVLGTAVCDGGVEVYVQDSGPGLAPEVRKRLFEPFFSTKPHGLGMGLTIVRTIVERHGGSLRSENGSGGGALFTVTLPAETTNKAVATAT